MTDRLSQSFPANRAALIAFVTAGDPTPADTGAILDATPTEAHTKFLELAQKDGLKAAVRWRESQFED